jgi:alpha-L-arabinofuranosidase
MGHSAKTIALSLWMGICILIILIVPLVRWQQVAQPAKPATLQFTVQNQHLNPIDDRLFGQFLERASFGEPGPEVALQPGTQKIQPQAIERMQQMKIPLLRFPGGTDVDYMDWRDLISNAPGRGKARPISKGHTGQAITNQFGLDEYFQLRNTLGVETILVVNVLDALTKKVPLEAAALNAAGLVAYANAPLGATLPSGMPDWPAIRARNGHAKPYRAEYLQIGNEWWMFLEKVKAATRLQAPDDLAQWFLTGLKTYITTIRAVDPQIQFIIDGRIGDDIEKLVLADPDIRKQVAYVAFHAYAPGPMEDLKEDGKPSSFTEMTHEDWWQTLVAVPGEFSDQGENIALVNPLKWVKELGYGVAITEWNWNGWPTPKTNPKPELNWRYAAGIGTAGFLNGLIRTGDLVQIACQSMLVGANWDITSIRIDPQGKAAPYFLPQGQMTLFYNQHHGQHRLAVNVEKLPQYQQPFSMGWVQQAPYPVALVDLVATATEQTLYIHAINRNFEQDQPMTLDLSAFQSLGKQGTHHLYQARSQRWFLPPPSPEIAQITANPITISKQLTVLLPKQSVSILEIPLSSTPSQG